MDFIISEISKGITFFIIGFSISLAFEISTKKWAMWDKKIGWQIHHSVFGILLILISLFYYKYRIELIFSGIGIVIQHTVFDGFVFVKRWGKK